MENHSSLTGWQEFFFFLIKILLIFGGLCNRYFWDIRLKIFRLLNFDMLFQVLLARFSKCELFSCLLKVDHDQLLQKTYWCLFLLDHDTDDNYLIFTFYAKLGSSDFVWFWYSDICTSCVSGELKKDSIDYAPYWRYLSRETHFFIFFINNSVTCSE